MILLMLLILCSPIIISFVWVISKFYTSEYSKETKKGFFKVRKNKGDYGEYLTASILQKVPGYHRMVLNCYIPTGEEQTTEIDLIFIHETGIYVMESKNYSGWIFGDEENYKWCQSFPRGKKQFFYNPIKQNKTHMDALQKKVSLDVPMTSVIVFSERCELKKIEVTSPNVYVRKRGDIKGLMKKLLSDVPKRMTKEEIDRVHNELKLFSMVSEEIKTNHIMQISSMKQ